MRKVGAGEGCEEGGGEEDEGGDASGATVEDGGVGKGLPGEPGGGGDEGGTENRVEEPSGVGGDEGEGEQGPAGRVHAAPPVDRGSTFDVRGPGSDGTGEAEEVGFGGWGKDDEAFEEDAGLEDSRDAVVDARNTAVDPPGDRRVEGESNQEKGAVKTEGGGFENRLAPSGGGDAKGDDGQGNDNEQKDRSSPKVGDVFSGEARHPPTNGDADELQSE